MIWSIGPTLVMTDILSTNAHSEDSNQARDCVGNLIDRPEQLPELKDTVVNGGIWAPTIRHHNGVYYVVTTLVYADRPPQDFSRWKNFLVTAMNPAGPWSDPLFFDYPGYDTSIFFDNNSSRVFIQGSFYHRIRAEISQLELDLKTGQSLSGEPQRIWSGTGQKAPEAPHLLHKDNWYYLIIAEGLFLDTPPFLLSFMHELITDSRGV